MAYDEGLAQRVHEALANQGDLVEKKMFGGVGYLVRGNMACGVLKDDLILRLGPEAGEAALMKPHTRVFDITGRAMKGWVMVSPEGYATDKALQDWVDQGLAFALTLPPK
ncbi:TfoX/Sxy family protein [bacterium]|nr:TfoX/Sxy family protein [bacterium]